MADPVETNNSKAKKSKDITKMAKDLSQPESKVILDEMSQLAEAPEYTRTVPPDTRQNLRDTIQQAREMYEKEATKNDWLDLAQTLAGAVTQFSAAQAGMKSGHNMSRLNIMPNSDWAGRTERARKDYLSKVDQEKSLSDMTRQDWQDSELVKQGEYKKVQEPLSARLKNAQEIEGDEARFNREKSLAGEREKRDNDRIDNTNKRLEYQSLETEIKSLSKTLQDAERAADTAINRILNDKASSKDAKKYAAQNPELLAKGGITADVWSDIVEKSKDEGVLGTGFLRGENKETMARLAKEASKNYLDGIEKQIDDLRAKQQGTLGKSDTALQPAATPVQSNTDGASDKTAPDMGIVKSNAPTPGSSIPAPNSMVRVQYKGQTLDIPRAQLKEALADGAKLVK